MSGRLRLGAALAALWALPVAAALLTRPLLPVDETRYLSVAWEMWNRGEWLVPHLNGAPYSDKPPLLFWAFLLGWKLWGVGELWPRLCSPLAALAALALLHRLGRELWADDPEVADRAVVFLAGSLLWLVYQTVVLFDPMLTACVLCGWLGLYRAARDGSASGWGLYAAGLGLGILAKGPIALLLLLATGLAALFGQRPRSGHAAYLSILAGATLLGCGLALLWALPAARAGGETYAEAILWRQTAGRVVQSFAHRRPIWWYLPLLPLALLPWSLWPRLWRGLALLLARAPEPGLRFCLAGTLPALAILSLASGKQVHYLVPLLPLVALVFSRAIVPAGAAAGRLPLLPLAALAALTVAIAHFVLSPRIASRYDLAPFARCLKAAEERGLSIAHAGRYQGEFHFLGRLLRPIRPIEPAQVEAWLAERARGAGHRVAELWRGHRRPTVRLPSRPGRPGGGADRPESSSGRTSRAVNRAPTRPGAVRAIVVAACGCLTWQGAGRPGRPAASGADDGPAPCTHGGIVNLRPERRAQSLRSNLMTVTSQHRRLPELLRRAAAVGTLLLAAAAPLLAAEPLHLRSAAGPAAEIDLASGDRFADLALPAESGGVYLVQHRGPIAPAWREALQAAGAEVLGYVPADAYLVRVAPSRALELLSLAGTERVVPFRPVDRLDPALAGLLPGKPQAGRSQAVRVSGTRGAGVEGMAARALAAAPGAVVLFRSAPGAFRPSLVIDVQASGLNRLLRQLALDREVEFVEPVKPIEPQNVDAAWVLQTGIGTPAPDRKLFARRLNGVGQVVALADTGVDHDACQFRFGGAAADVTDFNPTLAPAVSVTNPANKITTYYLADAADAYDTAALAWHGTKVAGSIAGDNHSPTRAQWDTPFVPDLGDGMAPGAQIVVQDLFDQAGTLVAGLNLEALLVQAYGSGARVHNFSHGTPPYDFGSGRITTYDIFSADVDETLWRYRDLTSVWAAGNWGAFDPVTCEPGPCQPWNGRASLVGLGAVAKNTVTVGATLSPGENPPGPGNVERLAPESSRGPTLEGLLKPDVVAPGHNLTAVDDGTGSSCQAGREVDRGTSLAAGAISGMSALVRSYFTDGFYCFPPVTPASCPNGNGARNRAGPTAPVVFNPSNALVKAVLVNSARQLVGSNVGDDNLTACTPSTPGCTAPTFGQGWGRVTLDDTLYLAGDGRELRVLYDIWNGSTGFENEFRGDDPQLKEALRSRQTHNYAVSIAAPTQALRCTLAWSDPAPSPAAAAPLVNDLDFEVHAIGPDNTWDTTDDEFFHGNAFHPDRPFSNALDPSWDSLNTVENVWIQSPRAGVYNLRVYGKNVPGNGLTGVLAQPATQVPGPSRIDSDRQGYALVCSGDAMQVKAPPSVTLSVVPIDPVCVEDSVSFDFNATCNAASGCGPCASFAWDFGDGTPVTFTSINTTSHVYTVAGLFLASVTARDSCGVEGRTTFAVEVVVGDTRVPPGTLGNTVKIVKTPVGLKVTWTDLPVPEATMYNAYDFVNAADVSAYPVGPPGTAIANGTVHGAVGFAWCTLTGTCASHPDYLQVRAANCRGVSGP